MKLSDYVALFLARKGIRHIFSISGGASLHLIHSIRKTDGIEFVCPQHEQAGAMAADGYARVSGGLGAALATSGPGATNLITGICSAYYDSVPIICITGQVASFRMTRNLGVRQLGFQETDVIDIFRPITKYVTQITAPDRIRYELEKACHLATSGRPGPVVVDIPDDFQRADIDPENLPAFTPEGETKLRRDIDREIDRCVSLLSEASRPIVVPGWGIHLAKARKDALEFIEALGFPVAPTWAMRDLLPADHPLLVGAFGSHGTRYGNFAVQNSDLLLVIGSRLGIRETGGPPYTEFARAAKKIMVDIDPSEIAKFTSYGCPIDVPVKSDAGEFLRRMNKKLSGIKKKDFSNWLERINSWKERYPICQSRYFDEEALNPYVFVRELSKVLEEDAVIFSDTGCGLAWMMQGFEFKRGQRFYHDFNNTAMGYSLPATIGACFALNGNPLVCLTGDGSLQMNIQELATVIRHHLPIKIFLINNHGFSMIRQTQDQWFGPDYLASSVEGGLAFPDFARVAEAYGFKVVTLEKNRGAGSKIREVLECPGPVFCNVEIKPEHRVTPQVKYGRPLEDAEPLLDRKEFFENMIVPVLDVCKKDL